MSHKPHAIALALLVLPFAGCSTAEPPPRTSITPAAPTATREAMVTAADPRAVEAGLQILREGGNALDAAIATMMVLGLVEPQSAGLGGGGFLLHYDAASEAVVAYDGREKAPLGARPDMFLQRGQPIAFGDAVASGRSIGTPALIPMLKLAHDEHGALPWAQLFEPAIALAETGFEVSETLARGLAANAERGRLRTDIAARAYFFDAQGAPWPAGHILRNPTYARTLRAIAEQGPDALRQGPIAESIVRAARLQPRAGTLGLADLQAYEPRRLEPLCGAFRTYRVCTMGSPSSGSAVLSVLGLYERVRPNPVGADNADDWAAFLWANRLAYADRDHYVADDQFVPVPNQELFAPAYLDQRAALVDLTMAPTSTPPGAPAGEDLRDRWGSDALSDSAGTTHLSIVDADGNAVSMTATIEAGFGAQRMAGGFLLNNELTDFSFRPTIDGRPVANAVEPGKRPRSSMSPTIVLDEDGELEFVIGSPGGTTIIAYVSRALIGVLDWDQTVQDAISTGNVVARSAPARMETSRLAPGLAAEMTARGWEIRESNAERSGLHGIRVTPEGLQGGADPRREGAVGRIEIPLD